MFAVESFSRMMVAAVVVVESFDHCSRPSAVADHTCPSVVVGAFVAMAVVDSAGAVVAS